MAYILNSGHVSPRVMAILGAVLSSLGIIVAGFLTSVTALGVWLALTGIGLSTGYIAALTLLNDYFQEDYVLMNSISNLGSTAGALVVPVIIERALQAYGFSGAMLILGGINLHAIVASVCLRTKKSNRESFRGKGKNSTQEMPDEVPLLDDADSDNEAAPMVTDKGMIKDKTGSYTAVFLFLGAISCVQVLMTLVFKIAQWRRDANHTTKQNE